MESEDVWGEHPRVYVRLAGSPNEVHTGRLVEVTEVVLVLHADGAPDSLLTYYPMRQVRQFDLEVDPDDIG
jgi:hypothetical protein